MANIVSKLFLAGVLISVLFLSIGCLETAALVEEHSFSNLMIDGDMLWFGAGYKLYKVDMIRRIATLAYDADDLVISFVKIDGKRLFFGGSSGRKNIIWSLDLDSENILWKQEIDSRFTGSFVISPLLDKELLMIAARHTFYSIDKVNGDIRWKIENNWFGTGDLLTPILADGRLIYGTYIIGENGPQSNHTIAFADPSSGRVIRTIVMPGRLGAIPVFHESCLFVKDKEETRLDDLRLNCLDFHSGKIIWSVGGKGYPESSQIGFYDGLVFDIFADRLFAIDEQSGSLLWQSDELAETIRNPQVIKALEWVALEAPDSHKVVFLEFMNGKLRDETLQNVLSSPIFIDREAIYGTTNAIVRVDIVTGNIIWSIPADSHYFVRQIDD